MYLRFIVSSRNHESQVRNGLFNAAWNLRERDHLPAEDEARLAAHFAWFDAHMNMPDRFNRTKSKGHYRRASKGISWFKDSAQEHIKRMHAIAAILERHGVAVETIRTDRPGYIVYEDDHQIVAEPFRDTPVG